jgi:hypothetical protein
MLLSEEVQELCPILLLRGLGRLVVYYWDYDQQFEYSTGCIDNLHTFG